MEAERDLSHILIHKTGEAIDRALWSREMYGPDHGVSGSSQDLMHEKKDRLISFEQGINIRAQYFISILAFAPMGIDPLLRATLDRAAITAFGLLRLM